MNRNRLHSLRNIVAVLLACVGFASCSQDDLAEKDTSLPAGKYPLELTASIGEAIAAPATRGTAHDTWPYDGVLKIVSSIDQKDEDNIEWDLVFEQYNYKVSADGTVELLRDYYWEKSDERLHIYVGASTLGIEGVRWSVRPDQSNEADLNDSDYLTAYGILSFHEKEHTLEFRHLTSKITVNLKQSDYLKAQDPDDVKVTLGTKDEQWYIEGSFKGQPKEIRLEAAAEAAAAAEEEEEEEELEQTEEIIPYTYKTPDPTAGDIYATYEAILIPQKITGTGKTIQIKVGDAIYNYTIECPNGNFSGGEEWIYNITVNENELDVAIDYNASIDWGADGETGSGEVELP